MQVFVGIYILIFILLYVVMLGVCIASYVMQALGLHRIAKTAGVSNPWLSWLPIGRVWILGTIADSFDRARGLNRRWRTALLVSSLLVVIFFVLFYVALIAVSIVTALATGLIGFTTSVGEITVFSVMFVGVVALTLATTALEILNICCLYKVYDEIYPEKAIKYLLLSFLIPLGKGICFLRIAEHYESVVAPDEEQAIPTCGTPEPENEDSTSDEML